MYKNCVVKLLSLFLLVLSGLSYGDVDQGYEWLAGQQQADGQFSSAQGIATPQQETTESLLALLQQTAVSFDQDAALNSIIAESGDGTEALARKIIALGKTGGDPQVYIDILLTYQNNDGGFGSYIGFESSAIDTAFTQKAMTFGNVNASVVEASVRYLLGQQQSDGSFNIGSSEYSSAYVTAMASKALQAYRFNFSLTQNLNSATDYLLVELNEHIDQLADWEIAYGISAVSAMTVDAVQYNDAVELLKSTQQLDGAWGQDSFITAVVLQALNAAVNPPIQTSSINGRVIESQTNQPILGVQIDLQGPTPSTSYTASNGQFSFLDLDSATYTLTLTAPGYQAKTVSLNVVTGQNLNLSDISLDIQMDSGVIRGVVTDASTDLPLAGTTLTFSGGVSGVMTTDVNGFYQVSGVASTFNVTVGLAAYQSVSASGNLVAGGVINFSPSLYPTGDVIDAEVTVSGRVLNSSSQPIDGVSVSETIHSASVITNSQGLFEIPNLSVGQLVVSLSKLGFQTSSITIAGSQGAHINLGDLYLTSDVLPEFSTLQGIITDAESGDPVAGANVSIGELGLSVISDQSGAFRIDDVSATEFSFSVSSIGYFTRTANVNVSQHGLIVGDVPLQAAATSDIEIVSLHAEQGDIYQANDEVELDVYLRNNGTELRTVRLYISVIDETLQVVEQFPAVRIPLGGDINLAYIELQPGQEIETEVEWYPGAIKPGAYQIVVQAYDSASQLLAERGYTVELLTTSRIGGLVQFGPPVTQLAENRLIELKADVMNRGNVSIGGGSDGYGNA